MIRREKIKILGVDCLTCVYAIERNLSKLNGVKRFNIDISSGEAIVEYDDTKNILKDIYLAIRDAGYDVEKKIINIYIDISPEEQILLEEKLLRFNGILDIAINPVTNTAKISYNPQTTTNTEILKELTRLGVKYSEIREVRIKKRSVYVLYRRVFAFTQL